jgi:RNA polymerase sigma factor (sigma-70 family)
MHVVERIAKQVHAGMTHIDIEDLKHDGYIGLCEAARTYSQAKGVFEHYCYFRVRGAMFDAHRRSAYRDDTLFLDSIDAMKERLGFVPAHIEQDHTSLKPDEIAARREQARLLAAAVSELLEEERWVFMRSLQGFPIRETAQLCGRSVAWARTKLASARAQLGARVISWGVGLDKAA